MNYHTYEKDHVLVVHLPPCLQRLWPFENPSRVFTMCDWKRHIFRRVYFVALLVWAADAALLVVTPLTWVSAPAGPAVARLGIRPSRRRRGILIGIFS